MNDVRIKTVCCYLLMLLNNDHLYPFIVTFDNVE